MGGVNDDESNWVRQLLTALAALAVVSAVVGGIVGVVALGAADVVGLAGDEESASPVEPSLYIPPPPSPSPSAPSTPGSTGPEAPTSAASPSASETTEKPDRSEKKPRNRRITLSASPQSVSEMERIDLTGRYRGGSGATLQVQRFEGGSWDDFPVTVTVSGGSFSTYVLSGRTGQNRFRVLDHSAGRASNPVTVRIG